MVALNVRTERIKVEHAPRYSMFGGMHPIPHTRREASAQQEATQAPRKQTKVKTHERGPFPSLSPTLPGTRQTPQSERLKHPPG